MKELWKTLDWERKIALLVILIGILLLSVFLWVSTRPGILYKGEFLPEQTENFWQGIVMGEDVSVTIEDTQTGKAMLIVCDRGTTEFVLDGSAEHFVLYQNGTEKYRGGYRDGMLLNEAGTVDAEESFVPSITVSVGGTVWFYDEDGDRVQDTPLVLPKLHAISLLLGESERVRGEPGMAIPAAILLIVLVLNLWFPQISYWLTIRRWTSEDVEPSDSYYVSRAVENIVCGAGFLVMLAMGIWAF